VNPPGTRAGESCIQATPRCTTFREKVTPGTSALFALTSGAHQEKMADEFRGIQTEIIRTNLSDEQEAQLREAFGLEN
jgi:uncharacterized membrane protein